MHIDREKLAGSVRERRLHLSAFVVMTALVAAGSVYASAPASYGAPDTVGEDGPAGSEPDVAGVRHVGAAHGNPELTALDERVRRVTAAWSVAADYYDREIAPIEGVLARYGGDEQLSRRIAVALVREANREELEPRLLLAVLLVENPWLDPKIRSPVGAIGLMQIMPVHRGGWYPCGADLEDVDDNICHGASIFAHYYRQTGGDLERALLRYNGCVTGSNTPDCHMYPSWVFARAGEASVRAWMGQEPGAGPL